MVQDDEHNRMAIPNRRGRPTLEEVANRQFPTAVPVTEALVEVAPLLGMICPCCGRAMVPQRIRTAGAERHERCTACGRTLVVHYDLKGKRATVRPV